VASRRALLIGILLFDECGLRLGRLRARRTQKEGDATVGTIVTAELGLLAFLVRDDSSQLPIAVLATYCRLQMSDSVQRVKRRVLGVDLLSCRPDRALAGAIWFFRPRSPKRLRQVDIRLLRLGGRKRYATNGLPVGA